MHPADIQAELKKRGITQRAIAKETGRTTTTISKVINKTEISDSLMQLIAEKIGRDVSEVFPEYYLQPPKRSTSKAFGPQPSDSCKETEN